MSTSPLETMHIRQLAPLIALTAHRTQKRKWSSEDYVYHCARVAAICEASMLRQSVPLVKRSIYVAGCWCHDILEDTDYSLRMLRAQLGQEVARIVTGLTDVTADWPEAKIHATPREERDRINLQHVLDNPDPLVQVCKLCDLYDNASHMYQVSLPYALKLVARYQKAATALRAADPVLAGLVLQSLSRWEHIRHEAIGRLQERPEIHPAGNGNAGTQPEDGLAVDTPEQ